MPDLKNFKTILNKALANPNDFNATILPELEINRAEKIQELLNIFDGNNVIFTTTVSDFLINNLVEQDFDLLANVIKSSKIKKATEIINILGTVKHKNSISTIALLLSNDNDNVDLIIPSVKALTNMASENKAALDALVSYFSTCTDETKLSISIRLLSPLSSLIVPIFLSKYRSFNDDKKVWVIKYLAETGHPDTVRLFADELAASPLDKGVFCIYGLGKVKSDEAVAILSKQCKNNEWFIRKKVAEALGHSEKSSAIEPLLCLLNDQSLMVQAAAVEALSKVGNLQPEMLIEYFKKANKVEKVNLIRTMGQMANEIFVPTLLEALKDSSAMFVCIDAIGDLGFKSAAEPLKELLNNKVWFNRLNALEALWKLEVEDIGSLAQKAIKDENDMVRNTASRILASISHSA